MKRPHLVHFLAIKTEESIAIKASVAMINKKLSPSMQEVDKFRPRLPIDAIKLLNANEFTIKIVGLTDNQKVVYEKHYDSDSYGNFQFKIPLKTEDRKAISKIQVFETKRHKGLELLMGNFIPLVINSPKKVIICDFDKTLVDTKYSTTKEIYRSLTSPIEKFPLLEKSLELLQQYTKEGFHPFILSASPHFYEDAMRDWLYQNKVYTAGIFLKDYRKILSFIEGELTPKDIKVQGLYKLNHLLDILHMTGIPNELVLMGDNFESDPIIYMGLAKMLKDRIEPRRMWSTLKSFDAFKLSNKQDSQLLNKIYQLHSLLVRSNTQIDLKIFIRRKAQEKDIVTPDFFQSERKYIELYNGTIKKEQ